MTNETLQTTIQSPAVVKGEILVALSKEGLVYQQLLQEGENIHFTRDNIEEERSKLAVLRKLESNLKNMENPWTAKWKEWNENRKSLLDPVSQLTAKKSNELSIVSCEIEAEKQKIEAEKQRKAKILSDIDEFFITQSQAIAAAQTPEELVRIEKLIGSHKGNKARYQEFLPIMADKAEILAQLIKTQKDAIKKITGLRAKEQAAELSGDDEAVLNLREEQESVTATIEQAKIEVQTTALNMATKADVVEPEIIIPVAPKPKRQTWKWEVVDLKAAQKSGLTITIPDKEKIDARLKEIREEEKECIESGIRYYIEKRF